LDPMDWWIFKLAHTARVIRVDLATCTREIVGGFLELTSRFRLKFGPTMSFAIHIQIALILSQRIVFGFAFPATGNGFLYSAFYLVLSKMESV
jgi:hypothetical protein